MASAATENPYAGFGTTVADAQPSVRMDFVRKTYMHLAAAVYGLAALEWAFFKTGVAERLFELMFSSQLASLGAFGAFMIATYVASRWASSDAASVGKQYAGLSLYVVAEALFLAPILWYASNLNVTTFAGEQISVITAAAATTLLIFGGLTAIPWLTGKDFSFLGAGLGLAGIGVFALIVASMIFGFGLGTWFTVAMILFASAYILYDTSNVMNHYQPGQHVAASLALFASVALLFWYVLQLFISMSSRE